MKINLLGNSLMLMVTCAVSPMTALAQVSPDEPLSESEQLYEKLSEEVEDVVERLQGTPEEKCESNRADCVDHCDAVKRRDNLAARTYYDAEAEREQLRLAMEEARFCRDNCDSDFNVCMGRRPERWGR